MSVQVATVTSLYDLAVDLLDAVVSAMATTEAGAPTISYISLGEPAFGPESCDEAIVQINGLTEGQTSPSGNPAEISGQRFRYGSLNEATLTAYAMRCLFVSQQNQVPYAGLTVADLSAASKQAYEDGWAIWNWVKRSVREGNLFGGNCSIVHFVGGTSYTPEAGLGGWRFVCRVALDGYDPTVTEQFYGDGDYGDGTYGA